MLMTFLWLRALCYCYLYTAYDISAMHGALLRQCTVCYDPCCTVRLCAFVTQSLPPTTNIDPAVTIGWASRRESMLLSDLRSIRVLLSSFRYAAAWASILSWFYLYVLDIHYDLKTFIPTRIHLSILRLTLLLQILWSDSNPPPLLPLCVSDRSDVRNSNNYRSLCWHRWPYRAREPSRGERDLYNMV